MCVCELLELDAVVLLLLPIERFLYVADVLTPGCNAMYSSHATFLTTLCLLRCIACSNTCLTTLYFIWRVFCAYKHKHVSFIRFCTVASSAKVDEPAPDK